MGILDRMIRRKTNNNSTPVPNSDDLTFPSYVMDADGQVKVARIAANTSKKLVKEIQSQGYTVSVEGTPRLAASLLYSIARYYDFDFENKHVLLFVDSMILLANYELKEFSSEAEFDISDLGDLSDIADGMVLQAPRENKAFFTAVYTISAIICNDITENKDDILPRPIIDIAIKTFRHFITDTLGMAGFPIHDPMEITELHSDIDMVALSISNQTKNSMTFVKSLLGEDASFKGTYRTTLYGFYCACIVRYYDYDVNFFKSKLPDLNKLLSNIHAPSLELERCLQILADINVESNLDSDAFAAVAANQFVNYVICEMEDKSIRTRKAELYQFGRMSIRNYLCSVEDQLMQ